MHGHKGAVDSGCGHGTGEVQVFPEQRLDFGRQARSLVGFRQGSGNPGLTTAVDAFTFDKVTYNFEQKPVKATSKEECKNDGYKNFQTSYKNQGDCVSSVASNGKDKGNPSVVESLIPTVRGLFGL